MSDNYDPIKNNESNSDSISNGASDNSDIMYDPEGKRASYGASEDEGEEVVYDDEEVTDSFGRSGKEKKLREQLKKCQEEKAEYLAGWQRAKADLVNQRREFEERSLNAGNFAKESLVVELLGVLDSFEMAFKNKEVWEKVDENWRRGVEYIHTQFDKVLSDHGLSVVPALGEKFNPTFHESVETIPTDEELEDDVVAEVVQNGYKMKDRVLRPAKVKVWEYTK